MNGFGHKNRSQNRHPQPSADELALEFEHHGFRHVYAQPKVSGDEISAENRMVQSCPLPEDAENTVSSISDEDVRYALEQSLNLQAQFEHGGGYRVQKRRVVAENEYWQNAAAEEKIIVDDENDDTRRQHFVDDGAPFMATSSHSTPSPKQKPVLVETDRFGFQHSANDVTPNRELLLPVAKLRKRELKWVEMLDKWPSFMNKRYDKIRARCRKGIPPSFRGRAWCYLSGAFYHMNNDRSKTVFEALDSHPGDPRWNDDIKKDIFRQFPEHELFSRQGPYGKLGQEDLFRLLKAYTVLHPEEGYCQGQAPVAATLLMHMPLKDAFYTFVQVCHKYLPGYYSPGLEAIQMDGDILYELLRKKSHVSYKHLKKHNVDPVLYMVEWFMCIYCRALPWATVLRVWDMFFCEGVKTLFKVAIVLFKGSLGTKEQCKQYPEMYEIVERLRHLPPHVLEEEFLMSKLLEMKLDDEDLERIHYKTLKRRHEQTAKKKKNVDARTI